MTEHRDSQENHFVLLERPRPEIALVTLNRPEWMNGSTSWVPLKKLLDQLTCDDSARGRESS